MANYIDDNGKRNIHSTSNEYLQALEKFKDYKFKYPDNKKAILEYIQACRLGKVKSNNSYKKVTDRWLYRVLSRLKSFSEDWLKKDFNKATPEDFEALYEAFETNKIKQYCGKPYGKSTKKKIYDIIKKFARWKFGNDEVVPEWCIYWRSEEPIIEKTVITETQLNYILDRLNSIKSKTLLLMLFDGGFRVEEAGNIRWCDISKPVGKSYYRVHLRSNTTKTRKERHVSLFMASKMIDAYKKHCEINKTYKLDGYLFPMQYRQFSKYCEQYSKYVNVKISPHILRHSSASHYAGIIRTYQQFCARYGWSLASNTAQRYFHTQYDDEVSLDVDNAEASKLQVQLSKTQQQMNAMQENMEKMQLMIAKQVVKKRKK
jgi:integrase